MPEAEAVEVEEELEPYVSEATSEHAHDDADAATDYSELDEEIPVETSSYSGLGALGWLAIVAGVGLGGFAGVQLTGGTSGGLGMLSGFGGTAFLLLGASCLLSRRVLRRLDEVRGLVNHEIQGLVTVSERTHSVFDGLAGFQERLEAIQSDRMAATLNQIRYEVSSLHEKVHRELFPTSEMQPVLAEISGSVGRLLEAADQGGNDGSEHIERDFETLMARIEKVESTLVEMACGEDAGASSTELQQFCNNLQDAVHRLNPGFESLQSAVESSSTTTDRTLQAVTELVGRLESEIRDLDGKADRILDLSHTVQEAAAHSVAAATPVAAASHAASSSDAGGDEGSGSGLTAEQEEALAKATSGADAQPNPKRDSTFLSAVERLKGLRGE